MCSITNNHRTKDLTKTTPYTLRPATLEDAYEIWSVMDTVYEAMEDKDLFICDDLDYVKSILSGHGFGVVACASDGKIVGNLLVYYPQTSKENLGHDLSFDDAQLSRVVHMDSSSVLPSARGHHLESRMLAYAESLIDTSRFSYLTATVSPDNAASLKSLLKNGYEIKVTKEKYSGLIRCIMLKKL